MILLVCGVGFFCYRRGLRKKRAHGQRLPISGSGTNAPKEHDPQIEHEDITNGGPSVRPPHDLNGTSSARELETSTNRFELAVNQGKSRTKEDEKE